MRRSIPLDALAEVRSSNDKLYAEKTHTHKGASATADGFMTAAEKKKLDTIPTGTVGSTLQPIYWKDGAPDECEYRFTHESSSISLANEYEVPDADAIYNWLNDNDLTDTITINKGGTGATTAEGALNNLGVKNRTHIVVAAYDTKNSLKNNADFTCNSGNASAVLREALKSIKTGGKIELLDGTYNLQYEENGEGININVENITIEGQGYTTQIKQASDASTGESNPIFTINCAGVYLSNLRLEGVNTSVSKPKNMVVQKALNITYKNIQFNYNAYKTNCIEVRSYCPETRILECKFNRSNARSGGSTAEGAMVNLTDAFDVSGSIISGNLSWNRYVESPTIDIYFNSEERRKEVAIYGHTAIEIYYDNIKETIDYLGKSEKEVIK